MNAVSLRTERAIVDWLSGLDWSASPIGTPTCLTSFGHGAHSDPDLEDSMPSYPRIVVNVTRATPVMPSDTTCEMEVRVDLQLSADDTLESAVLKIVEIFDSALQDLFVENGALILSVGQYNENGPFTAQFAFPTDFGSTDIQDRSRVFSRTFTLFASATT